MQGRPLYSCVTRLFVVAVLQGAICAPRANMVRYIHVRAMRRDVYGGGTTSLDHRRSLCYMETDVDATVIYCSVRVSSVVSSRRRSVA